MERIIAKRGSFHVARISAYLWRGSDEWKTNRDILQKEIQELEKEPSEFAKHFDKAFGILTEIIRGSGLYAGDPDRALKSASLDRDLDNLLYQTLKKSGQLTLENV
ncbi:MAG: hypothetical protein ABFD81_17610 [Syntrophaceae bacterium]